ncbi:hypothetical protein BDZ91DRAFT_401093 [Kalaharituber pfeilii]|nr:hypothetical protein BDZ91DRAFT_401093 [Kalaharituber pfeilii]
MSKVIRSVKNVTKGYSSTQIKVRNATSNDHWGPTGSEMSEIARLTFDTNNDFFEIMDMLDRRLNDKGKNWRHVLKALKVLDYCLHEGSEHVVVWAKDNIYIIKTLREFQYIDEDGRDQGLSVRVTAKELTSLILDEERLRNERKDRKLWKSRVNPIDDYGSSSYNNHPHPERRQPRRASTGNHKSRNDDEDAEYRLAIEASKYSAEEERRRQASKSNDIDDDLEKAIKLSKEEEELRQKVLERANAESLFDDITPTQTPVQQQQYFQQPQYQQGYSQGPAVDLWGNPTGVQYQQPQSTGFLDNVYSQQGFPPQPTGVQTYQQFAQPTGFEQFQQAQPTGYDSQPAFLVQPTGFNAANPYNNTMAQQQAGFPQPGFNNPYANNSTNQAEALKPMPTGSNNPFAQFNRPQSPARTGAPSLGILQQQHQQQQQQQQASAFGGFGNATAPTPSKPENPNHAHLNALLAAGLESGQDTYGNVGNLRIPAQHTAPGTFINSAGQGRRTASQATGNNPFFNQMTGAGSLQPPPANRLVPAHTGPAGMGMNGYGGGFGQQQSSNPFSAFAPQQTSQQPTTGQLIDL